MQKIPIKFAHKLSINHIGESRMTSRARSVRPRGPLPMTSLSHTVVAIFTDRYHHCTLHLHFSFECQCIQHESANWGHYFYFS